MSQIIAISGSASGSSRSIALLKHLQTLSSQLGYTFECVHPRELDASDLLHAKVSNTGIAEAHQKIASAQVVIVNTPVYKAAYTGLIKAFLDTLPDNALGNKLVVPMVHGAAPTHYLTLEYALKPVLMVLGAEHLVRGLYIMDAHLKVTEEGLQIDADLQTRLQTMLNSIHAYLDKA
jgi:FMN reductase